MLGFVAVVLLARRLTPEAFGLVTLGMTLVAWAVIVVDAGTELLTTRDAARAPERFKALTEPVLGLRLATALVTGALFAAGALLFLGGDGRTLALFALVLPAAALNVRWIALAVQGSRMIAAANLAGQAVFVVGVVFLVTRVHETSRVALLQALAEAVYAVVVLVLVGRRVGRLRPRIDLVAWRRTLRESSPLMANQLSRAALYSFDLLLIAAVLARNQIGLYGAAYKPVLFCSTLAGLFSAVYLAAYSGLTDERGRTQLARRSVLAGLAVSVPLAAILAAAAGVVVHVVFGSAYGGSAGPLAVLAWTIPLLVLAVPYASALIGADRQRVLMRHNMAGAALNVAANLVAVPLGGILAAAWVTVASLALVLFLNHRSAVALGLAPPLHRAVRDGIGSLASRRRFRAAT